ncbi:hypothetical protein DXX93_14945 [Thalassotalea euphylliae]|uniref:Uncharacterized protein n=1 Tax=Thalassotalea euphylliae TaxID=1655234 RepID=A0A3E0TSV5_9GAMM|nr:hypothetical protein DXX93_14945 [Thalassotalea euphylliae]
MIHAEILKSAIFERVFADKTLFTHIKITTIITLENHLVSRVKSIKIQIVKNYGKNLGKWEYTGKILGN